MVAVYIGLGVIIVLIFAGFGISRWVSNTSQQNALKLAISTPTPGPVQTTKPIQLQNLQQIGKPILPTPDPKKGIMPDTMLGGRGSTVDDIPCESQEAAVLHIHSHLSLFVNGVQMQIPPFIGISPTATGGCLYWIHTHDGSGVIHVEAGSYDAPKGGPYTLGMFFDIWGEPLTRDQVGPFHGPVTAFLNGQVYGGNLADIPLREYAMITLEVGRPIVTPPNYKLPPGD